MSKFEDDIKDLQQHLKIHTNWGDLRGTDRVRFMVLALCGEAGELANLIKKDWRGDPGDRRAEIIRELADVGNYAFMTAEALGADLPSEMLLKLREVEGRATFRGVTGDEAAE
jgi:NTP pyrophosphatase (non-canonical NTP hydrolase)